MEEEKKKFLKKHRMSLFVIISVIVMLIGLSYAWLQLTLRGTRDLTLTVGTLSLELDDTMSSGIAMSEVVPVSDEDGLAQEGYTFTLENKGKIASDYTVYLDDLDIMEGQTRLPDNFIKYQLTRDGEELDFDLLNTAGEHPNRVLDSGTIRKGKKYTYILKMWIDSAAGNEIVGTIFKGQLRVEAVQSTKKPSASELLVEKANSTALAYENATEEEKREMFTFTHKAGTQQLDWLADELTDYRYIGLNPNNYVVFNDEIWRIIGIFTVEDETGKKERRMKIIRDQSIGNYSWDNKSVYGINDWNNSLLQQVLNNGPYYNRTSGICPYGQSDATLSCDFSSSGLTAEAKGMIGKAKWYLGGNTEIENIITSQSYESERSSAVYSGRLINWVGEVGLMYPSDYGYAASGNDCLTTVLDNYNSGCMETNWLFNSLHQWAITPYSNGLYDVFMVLSSGLVTPIYAFHEEVDIRPSVYLKSNVSIIKGDGSIGDPYQLKLS